MRGVALVLVLASACASVLGIDDPRESVADLSLAVMAEPTVDATAVIDIAVVATNAGPDTALDVEVTNTLPAGTTLVSADGDGWTCHAADLVVTCRRATATVGDTPRIIIVARATAVGDAIDRAEIASRSTDRELTNNAASFDTAVAGSADLAITSFGSGGNQPNTPVDYALTVTNRGPTEAPNVAVAIAGDLATTAATGTGWTCAPTDATTTTCTRAALAVGDQAQIAVAAITGPNAGPESAVATVSSAVDDPAPSNNVATFAVSPTARADLAIAVTATPDPVASSGTVTYTVTVTNRGPDLAGFVMVQPMPSSKLDVLVGAGDGWTCDVGAICTRANLAAGAAPPLVVTANVVGGGGAITTQFMVSGATDPVPANDLATAVVTIAPITGQFDGFVETPTTFAAHRPHALAIGDLDGDGKPDVASVDATTATLSIFFNTMTAGATPTFAPRADVTTADAPYVIALADLDGDGRLDVAIACNNFVSVYRNTTTPGATTPTLARQDLAVVGNPTHVAIADFDGDGKLDLAVATTFATVAIFRNTTPAGATTFSFAAEVDHAVNVTPRGTAIADFNADGKPDLAVANDNQETVSVLLDTGASFSTDDEFAVGMLPVFVAAADFDGDGKPDLAVANTGEAALSILRNTTATGAATPSFAAATAVDTVDAPRAIAIGDFNFDGMPDLAVANGSEIEVFLVGSFGFVRIQDFAIGTSAVFLATADLDGDGQLDLVMANEDAGTIGVSLMQ